MEKSPTPQQLEKLKELEEIAIQQFNQLTDTLTEYGTLCKENGIDISKVPLNWQLIMIKDMDIEGETISGAVKSVIMQCSQSRRGFLETEIFDENDPSDTIEQAYAKMTHTLRSFNSIDMKLKGNLLQLRAEALKLAIPANFKDITPEYMKVYLSQVQLMIKNVMEKIKSEELPSDIMPEIVFATGSKAKKKKNAKKLKALVNASPEMVAALVADITKTSPKALDAVMEAISAMATKRMLKKMRKDPNLPDGLKKLLGMIGDADEVVVKRISPEDAEQIQKSTEEDDDVDNTDDSNVDESDLFKN